MAEGVFVGRPRPLWKVILYSIITFGVYGRVWLFKTIKEIDGHEVYFFDMRLYKLGVIVPIIGPYIVKWRLAGFVKRVVDHDVTARPVSTSLLRWLGLIPWFPVYHALVQRHLTPHWDLHRKLSDLEARREVVTELKKTGRSKAVLDEIQRLEAEIREREKHLEDARQAAIAIRDAQRARAQAEAEMAADGEKKRRLRLPFKVPFVKPRPDQAGEPAGGEESPERRRRFGLMRKTTAQETPAESSGAAPAPEPAPGPGEAAKSRFGLFGRRKEPAEPGPESTPEAIPSEPAKLSAADQRRIRRERADAAAQAVSAAERPPEAEEEAPEEKKSRFGFFRRKSQDEGAPASEPAAAPEPAQEPLPVEAVVEKKKGKPKKDH